MNAPDELPRPIRLRCDEQNDPAQVPPGRPPRLAWEVPWAFHGCRPVACRVQVSSAVRSLDGEGEPDLWESGWVALDPVEPGIAYSGAPLPPMAPAWWRVKVRDAARGDSGWSDPARMLVGVQPGAWPAGWIAADVALVSGETDAWADAAASKPAQAEGLRGLPPVILFRREFEAGSAGGPALLFAAARGAIRIRLNGELLDDCTLDPVQTEYDKEIRYRAFDVGALLRPGNNRIVVELAGGWHHQPVVWSGDADYGPASFSLALVAPVSPGAAEPLVATGAGWRARASATLRANLYAGELHDARREAAEPDESEWVPASEVAPPAAPLYPQTVPPIREVETIPAPAVSARPDGALVVDLGANIAGALRIRPRGGAGHAVAVEYAEQLGAGGEPDRGSIGVAATGVGQVDRYLCAGREGETWSARWGYKGFRFAKVQGWPGEVRPGDFEGVVLRNAVEKTGAFACSDEFLNTFYRIACRSMEGNLHGLFEDCPAREKCGWLGDIMASYRAWWLNYDIAAISEKFLRDIRLATGEDGMASAIAGGKRKCGKWVDFAAATAVLPHAHYHRTGDRRLLAEHFPFMARYCDAAFSAVMARLAAGRPSAKDRDWFDIGLGDWADIPPEAGKPGGAFPERSDPIEMTAMRVCEALGRTTAACRVLGRPAEGRRFAGAARALADRIEAIYREPGGAGYGSQAADAFALALGLGGNQEAVVESLRARLEANGWHHDVGCFGHGLLAPVLARFGRADLALRTLKAEGYPGFADQIARGATTLWEAQGRRTGGGDLPGGSLNHHFHGGAVAFLFHAVAGLSPARGSVAWDDTDFSLPLIGAIKSAAGEVRSARGPVSSRWEMDAGTVRWRVVVPPGATASIRFPRAGERDVREAGRPLAGHPGVRSVREEPGSLYARIGSGEFSFEWFSEAFTYG